MTHSHPGHTAATAARVHGVHGQPGPHHSPADSHAARRALPPTGRPPTRLTSRHAQGQGRQHFGRISSGHSAGTLGLSSGFGEAEALPRTCGDQSEALPCTNRSPGTSPREQGSRPACRRRGRRRDHPAGSLRRSPAAAGSAQSHTNSAGDGHGRCGGKQTTGMVQQSGSTHHTRHNTATEATRTQTNPSIPTRPGSSRSVIRGGAASASMACRGRRDHRPGPVSRFRVHGLQRRTRSSTRSGVATLRPTQRTRRSVP